LLLSGYGGLLSEPDVAMVMYRRARAPGATYFFTVALRNRQADWLTAHVDLLRSTLRSVQDARPFLIDAMVVMPDHLHALWTLPEGDADFSSRWRAIKSGFVLGLRGRGAAMDRNAKGEAAVWQRRFWEHQIRDEQDFERHVDYVHFNPVKHGWVNGVAEWRWSTFHRYVRDGLLPADWGGGPMDGAFGE
jgi:putative transposase